MLQQLGDLKKRNEELEKERLSNVPIDTAKEIKNLQNKIVSEQNLMSMTHLLHSWQTYISTFTNRILYQCIYINFRTDCV